MHGATAGIGKCHLSSVVPLKYMRRAMKEEYQDKIDRYLLRQMPEDERQAFESEIGKDEELKEQLEFTEIVRKAIVGRNRRLAQIKEWENNYEIERWSRLDKDVQYCSRLERRFMDPRQLLEKSGGGGGGSCLPRGCILGFVAFLILLIIGCIWLFN